MNRPRLIGLVGASGSGKTTIARELALLADESLIISQDNYYITLPDNIHATDWNFDAPSAVDLARLTDDLAALKRGHTADGPQYHFASHKRLPEKQKLTPASWIIVEGLFLFSTPTLRTLFDLAVFIDVPMNVCLKRRIARDTIERGRTEAMIRQRWTEQVEPMFHRHIESTRKNADWVLKPDGHTALQCAREIFKRAD